MRSNSTCHIPPCITSVQIWTHKSTHKLRSLHTNSQDNIEFDVAKCAAQLLYGPVLVFITAGSGYGARDLYFFNSNLTWLGWMGTRTDYFCASVARSTSFNEIYYHSYQVYKLLKVKVIHYFINIFRFRFVFWIFQACYLTPRFNIMRIHVGLNIVIVTSLRLLDIRLIQCHTFLFWVVCVLVVWSCVAVEMLVTVIVILNVLQFLN